MRQTTRGCILACALLFGSAAYGQNTEQQLKRVEQGKTAVRPDELVSMKADVSYADAMKSLSEMSKRLAGKIIVDSSPMKNSDKTIGINVESMYWLDAFELILRSNQLWYNDNPEYFEVVSLQDVGKVQTPAGGQQAVATPGGAPGFQPARFDSSEIWAKLPQVTISTIFLDINTTKASEAGVSFSVFRGRDLNLGVEFTGGGNVSTPIGSITAAPTGNKVAVDLTTAINVFESDNLGEVLARPQITVRSGSTGRVQDGQDFSIKQRDFAGNVTDAFISAGIILQVTPRVVTVGDMRFIDLAMNVERSNAIPGAVSTIVNKTEASSRLNLLDGEEAYIGGLYQNSETTIREGVPFLKDLPAWFFGLRYLFGYDNVSVTREELIVIIKAEIVPILEERMKLKTTERDVQQDKLKELSQDLEKRLKK